MSLGLAPGDFWSATPAELRAIQRGAAARLEREQKHDMQIVYAQAALNRSAWHAKKFPRFDEMFRDKSRRQSPGQMRAMLKAWTAAMKDGGENGG